MSEEQVEQDSSGKESKAYDSNVRKLVAILNGESLLAKRQTVGHDDLRAAMEELTKEKKEALVSEVKTEVKALIEGKIAFDQFVTSKKKELEKAIQEKQKEFNQKCKGVYGKIERIDQLERTYSEALQSASVPAQEDTTTQEPA